MESGYTNYLSTIYTEYIVKPRLDLEIWVCVAQDLKPECVVCRTIGLRRGVRVEARNEAIESSKHGEAMRLESCLEKRAVKKLTARCWVSEV